MEFFNNGDTENYDEILSYVNVRYVSAHESCWRLFENEMQEQSHTIIRLAVHEPNNQNVYFTHGSEEDAVNSAIGKHTTLTAWFHLNSTDQEAKSIYYADIPNNYIFCQNTWKKRKQRGNKVIGRMYAVAPNDPERYFIRLLLLHVKGATSFESLRTVNNSIYSTFREAAIALGLVNDDREWHNCLTEMVSFQMPKQLRHVFAYICCFCQPSSPLEL